VSAPVSIDSTVVAEKGLLSTDLDRELVILSTRHNLYYGLNETGARIWHLIQEPRRVREIHAAMLDDFDVAPEVWERDLVALLQALVDHELVRTAA
jgi:hypothetical protein